MKRLCLVLTGTGQHNQPPLELQAHTGKGKGPLQYRYTLIEQSLTVLSNIIAHTLPVYRSAQQNSFITVLYYLQFTTAFCGGNVSWSVHYSDNGPWREDKVFNAGEQTTQCEVTIVIFATCKLLLLFMMSCIHFPNKSFIYSYKVALIFSVNLPYKSLKCCEDSILNLISACAANCSYIAPCDMIDEVTVLLEYFK